MALPEFTQTGDLPVGVHAASLAETVARFGTGSDQRKRLARRLKLVHQLASETGHLARFVVFGSFITEKHEPNDVDVFMIMDDNFDKGSLRGETRVLFDHGTSQDYFGCIVFWVRRMGAIVGEEAAMEDWQIKRDGSERGIVEITVE